MLHLPTGYEVGRPVPVRPVSSAAGGGSAWRLRQDLDLLAGLGDDALAGRDAELHGVLDAVGDEVDTLGDDVRTAVGLALDGLAVAADDPLDLRAGALGAALELGAGLGAAALEAGELLVGRRA